MPEIESCLTACSKQSSLVYNTSTRHERHKQQECDKNGTSGTQRSLRKRTTCSNDKRLCLSRGSLKEYLSWKGFKLQNLD